MDKKVEQIKDIKKIAQEIVNEEPNKYENVEKVLELLEAKIKLEEKTIEELNSLQEEVEKKNKIKKILDPNSTAESVTDKAKQLETEAKEKAKTAIKTQIKEKVGKIPLIGGLLSDLISDGIDKKEELENDKSISGRIKKWFILGIGGFFAGIFGLNQVKDFLNGKTVDIPTVETGVNPSLPEINTNLEEAKDKVNETKEIKKFSKYRTGLKFLLWSTGKGTGNKNIEISNENGTGIIEQIKDIKLKDMFDKDIDLKNNYESEKFQVIKNNITSNEFHDLVRIGLTKYRIESILNKKENDDKFKKAIGGEESLKNLKDTLENFDPNTGYLNLTIQQISVLYIETIPVLANGGLLHTKDFGIDLISGISEFVGEHSDENHLISKNLVSQIYDPRKENGIQTLELSEEDFLKNFDIKDKEEEEQQIKDLFKFKEYIMSDEFLKNPKIGFNEKELQVFMENINYKYILSLYFIIGNNQKIEDLNPSNLVLIYGAIGTILCQDSDGKINNGITATSYLQDKLKKINHSNDIFTEDEKTIFKIYGNKLAELFIAPFKKYIQAGFATVGINSEKQAKFYSIISLAGAGGAYLAWRGLAGTAIGKKRFPGPLAGLFRKLVWPLTIASAAFYFGSRYLDNKEKQEEQAFVKDLTDREKKLYNLVQSGNLEELLAMLEENEKERDKDFKIFENFNIDGEDKSLVFNNSTEEYKNVYVANNGKLYQVVVLDKSFWKGTILNNGTQGINWIIENWNKITSNSDYQIGSSVKINNKHLNQLLEYNSNISFDGTTISIGGEYSVDLSRGINTQKTHESKFQEFFQKIINSISNKAGIEIVNNNFHEIGNLGDDYYVGLVEIKPN